MLGASVRLAAPAALLLGTLLGGAVLRPQETAPRGGQTTTVPRSDAESLVGTWVRTMTNGEAAPDEPKAFLEIRKADEPPPEGIPVPRGSTLLNLRWRVSTEPPDGGTPERARIDPSTKPHKSWDFMPWEEREGKSYPGIYKLDGDTLTVCFYPGHVGAPPKTFDPPKPGESQTLDAYRRVKP